MLFAAEEYIIVSATMFAHFQHGGHEPEVVLFNGGNCCRPLSICMGRMCIAYTQITSSVLAKIAKFLSTSGCCPPSWIFGIRWYINVIVLQSAISEGTLEVLYNALTVTQTQLSLGSTGCH